MSRKDEGRIESEKDVHVGDTVQWRISPRKKKKVKAVERSMDGKNELIIVWIDDSEAKRFTKAEELQIYFCPHGQ